MHPEGTSSSGSKPPGEPAAAGHRACAAGRCALTLSLLLHSAALAAALRFLPGAVAPGLDTAPGAGGVGGASAMLADVPGGGIESIGGAEAEFPDLDPAAQPAPDASRHWPGEPLPEPQAFGAHPPQRLLSEVVPALPDTPLAPFGVSRQWHRLTPGSVKRGFRPVPDDASPGGPALGAAPGPQTIARADVDRPGGSVSGGGEDNDGERGGGGGSAPSPLAHNRQPSYPRLARRRGLEGTVHLRLDLLADGRVQRVHVLRSSGHRILDEAALDAARDWRFRPALVNGLPADAQIDVPIRFALRP